MRILSSIIIFVILVVNHLTLGGWMETLQLLEMIAVLNKQLEEANKIYVKADSLVKMTDTLVNIAGDPKQMLRSIQGINDASRQLDMIYSNDTTREFRKLNRNYNKLFYAKDKFDSSVKDSMLIGGKEVRRNMSLYDGYHVMENAYEELQAAIELDKEIQGIENARNKKLRIELKNAKTQAEIDKVNAGLNASFSLQESSHRQLMKRKAEHDLQKSLLEHEKQKKSLAKLEENDYKMRMASDRVKKEQEERKEKLKNKLKSTVNISRFRQL